MPKNRLIIPFLCCVAVAAIVYGCRKGEDDPLISLRSRKKRLEGEWKVFSWRDSTNFRRTTNNPYYYGPPAVDEGDSMMLISKSNLILRTHRKSTYGTYQKSTYREGDGIVAFTITFNKDGTFSRILEVKEMSITTSQGTTSVYYDDYHSRTETKGVWNFAGSDKDEYKKKERIILSILEESSDGYYTNFPYTSTNYGTRRTYPRGQKDEIWHIRELRNKKIVMDAEQTTTDTENTLVTPNGNGTPQTNQSESTEKRWLNVSLELKIEDE